MQVTHLQDQETHAVVGGNEIMSFGIAQTAEFFEVLSSTLYSNKPLAVIRETLCNAWDSHITSGRVDIPIEVTLDSNNLIIRDYGLGIPHDLMHPIYCIYGNSTKKNDGKQTGGFGLGSKAPFAYAEHFTVTSFHGGTKTVYAVSKGSALTDGKPDIRVMVKVPTTETGVELNIPIRSPADVREFTDLIKYVTAYGEMNLKLNGKELRRIPISIAENGIYITSQKIPMYIGDRIFVRYGNVIYPISSNENYVRLYDEVTKIIHKIPQYAYKWTNSDWCVIFQAEPNTIAVTPSRESLNLSDITIRTLTELFQKFISMYSIEKTSVMEELFKREMNQINYQFMKGTPDKIISEHNLNYSKKNLNDKDYYEIFNLNGYYDYLSNVVDFIGMKDYAKESLIRKLSSLLVTRNAKTNAIKDFLKIIKTEENWALDSWSHRFTTTRIKYHKILFNKMLKDIYKSKVVTANQVYIQEKGYKRKLRLVKNACRNDSHYNLLDFEDYLSLLKRVIILSPSRNALDNPIISNSPIITNDDVTFVCTFKPGTKDKVKEFWLNRGYHVVDNIDAYNEEQILLNEKATFNRPAPLPIKKKKKLEGYPTLEFLINSHGQFSYTSYRDKLSNTEKSRVLKPKAILQAAAISSSYSPHFFEFYDHAAHSIITLFGKEIGIAINETQLGNAIKDGALNGTEYIIDSLFDYINNSQTIIDSLILENLKITIGSGISFNALVSIGKYNKLIRDRYKLPNALSSTDELYLDIYNKLVKSSEEHYRKTEDWCKKFDALNAEFVKKLDPKKFAFLSLIVEKNEKRLRLIDLHLMDKYLSDKAIPLDLKVFIETTIISALRL